MRKYFRVVVSLGSHAKRKNARTRRACSTVVRRHFAVLIQTETMIFGWSYAVRALPTLKALRQWLRLSTEFCFLQRLHDEALDLSAKLSWKLSLHVAYITWRSETSRTKPS